MAYDFSYNLLTARGHVWLFILFFSILVDLFLLFFQAGLLTAYTLKTLYIGR